MAYHRVSNATELSSALRSAASGDTIGLESGDYGSLKLTYSTKALTLESVSAAVPATFKGIEVARSANVTFDDLAFRGNVQDDWGTGVGLKITNSRNVRIEDSEFQDFFKGVTASSSQDITVARNEFMRQAEDAMAFGNVDGLQVIGNAVNGMQTPVEQHHDMIQITPNSGMSSNVVIRGNVLDSNDLITHGIFFGAGSGAYRNVTIENNMVIGGHQHGITLGRTDGLTIAGNTVLRDAESTSTRPIDTPVINVGAGSSGVQITGNTTYAIKAASGVGVNNIVPVNVAIAGTPVPDGSGSGVRLPDLEMPTPDPEPPVLPDTGVGDVFSFDGDDVRGWTRAQEGPVDLGDGDTLRFVNYDADTFVGDAAGTAEGGETAEIASRADLTATLADSPDLTAQAWGSTLALRIAQDSGTHALVLTDVGDAGYFL